MKQVRKEERRQARRDKSSDDVMDHETQLKEMGFDPEILAAQR